MKIAVFVIAYFFLFSTLLFSENMNKRIASDFNTARQLAAAGNDTSALEYCQTVLKGAPAFAAVYALEGNIYMRMGLLKEAYFSFKKALSIMPANREAMLGLSKIYEKVRRYDYALWELDKYIAIAPGDSEARRIRQKLKSATRLFR